MSGVWGPQNAACPCFLPLPGSSRLLTPTAKGQCDVSAWLLTSPAPRHVGDRFLWGAPAPSAPLTRWLLSCCPHPSPSRSQLSVHSVGRQVWLRGRGGAGGAPQNRPRGRTSLVLVECALPGARTELQVCRLGLSWPGEGRFSGQWWLHARQHPGFQDLVPGDLGVPVLEGKNPRLDPWLWAVGTREGRGRDIVLVPVLCPFPTGTPLHAGGLNCTRCGPVPRHPAGWRRACWNVLGHLARAFVGVTSEHQACAFWIEQTSMDCRPPFLSCPSLNRTHGAPPGSAAAGAAPAGGRGGFSSPFGRRLTYGKTR